MSFLNNCVVTDYCIFNYRVNANKVVKTYTYDGNSPLPLNEKYLGITPRFGGNDFYIRLLNQATGYYNEFNAKINNTTYHIEKMTCPCSILVYVADDGTDDNGDYQYVLLDNISFGSTSFDKESIVSFQIDNRFGEVLTLFNHYRVPLVAKNPKVYGTVPYISPPPSSYIKIYKKQPAEINFIINIFGNTYTYHSELSYPVAQWHSSITIRFADVAFNPDGLMI